MGVAGGESVPKNGLMKMNAALAARLCHNSTRCHRQSTLCTCGALSLTLLVCVCYLCVCSFFFMSPRLLCFWGHKAYGDFNIMNEYEFTVTF